MFNKSNHVFEGMMDNFQLKINLDIETGFPHCEHCLYGFVNPAMYEIPGVMPIIIECPNCGTALDEEGYVWYD